MRIRFPLLTPAAIFCALLALTPASSFADPIGWAQPAGRGTPVFLSYSYGNLFDGGFNTLLSVDQIRDATEAALRLWTSVVPIHFGEVADSGPTPSDNLYPAAGTPDIRLGYHAFDSSQAAHTFFPFADGLGGDVHFNNASLWGYGLRPFELDFVGTVLHELGHSIGIQHIFGVPAIMSGDLAWFFGDPARIFLTPADIAAAQQIYGAGIGSVTPLRTVSPTPEPATIGLWTVAIAAHLVRRRLRGAPSIGRSSRLFR